MNAPDAATQRDMRPLDAYCLIPRPTKTGKVFVARAEWEDWFGDLVATNERRVSGFFGSREEAIPWCVRYCEENDGCLTSTQARALIGATE